MGQVFSTYPGFREPVRNAHTEWLFADEYLDHARRIELPTSRAAVPVPLLFWEVQALCLSGTADVGATEGESLRNSDVRAATNADGRAMIDIWAPNYGGTSVGPLKAVYGRMR